MYDAMARLEELAGKARRAEEIVAEWSARQFVGRAEEGRIVATTDALGTLLTLEISPLSRKRLDATRLADAILAAIAQAEEAAAASKGQLMNTLHP
ncbi:YbaB/EbfC family nucleoid-associated protein [Nonomuraea basaltis]|uniref:YbaB/EbfC family nucleoid-associated protein n=1 Tax=Nonomuraea basaltis TaxID=2495887 RepID=UPI001F0F3E28|nr:YbaB/EbfC family nucleoid-associated protein [Nonomuraea basaltis]